MLFPNKSQNGILRYLKRTLGSRYFDEISTFANNSHHGDLKDVFDFDDTTYWIVNNDAPDGNYLSFCLKNHVVQITGYEVKAGTYNENGTPYRWGFSAGNNTDNEEIEEYKMKQGETHYVPYSKEGFFNCFRYINRGLINYEGGVGPGYRSRVSQIELFGYLYLDKCRISCIKQHGVNMKLSFIISLVIS